MRHLGIMVAAALLASVLPAAANDSQAEFGLGGLTLTRSEAIRMASEELRISATRIEVDYVFLNGSNRDIETVVAFPLPDHENPEGSPEAMVPDYRNELDFRTTVDGRPAPLTLVETATFRGHDVTGHLRSLGLPIMPVYQPLQDAIARLDDKRRAELVASGLVIDVGGDTSHDWVGLWKVSTSVTRTQVFPAGRPVAVSHSYKPFVGGSVGGRFGKQHRRDDFFLEAKQKYCIDDDFLRAMDRRAKVELNGADYSEKWISYVLTSGANWAGPIGRFRLVVDKGAAGNLVSFCETGVRKIDDRRFEVVRENFVPKRNLDVLIVDFTQN